MCTDNFATTVIFIPPEKRRVIESDPETLRKITRKNFEAFFQEINKPSDARPAPYTGRFIE